MISPPGALGSSNPLPTITSASPTQAVAGATVPITLTGSGFLSNTVILVNGAAVPATYQSGTTMIAQVTAPAGSTGNFAVRGKNPAPGGGTGSAFQVGTASLQVNATDPDGTNTGTARLGFPVNFSTINTDTAHSSVSWTLQGAGTLSPSGISYVNATYTPPSTMPANRTVRVTTYLTNLPALTTSYTFTLAYPMPTITSASPSQAVAGATVPITLTGSGFVSNTVILVNGAAVPATYQSGTTMIAQVTAPAGSTGNLAVQGKNPAPGGGTGSAFQVGTASLQVNATDPDGTNTGTARLGVPVNFSTINTDTAHSSVSWTLQGAGTLSPGGTSNVVATYTPPSTMPANRTVTVTTYLTNVPALTTSYRFTLVNPVPMITSASPTQAVAGATVPITLTGSGFLSNTAILVNGAVVPATYQSATTMIAQVTAPTGSTSNLAVQGQNPAPVGGTGSAFQVGTASLQITATDPDGRNTGTARLGVPLNFSTTNTDTAHNGMAWTLNGAGRLTPSGTNNNVTATYTPPSTMPANPTVTVTAHLQYLPAVTTSYTFTLVNPVPTVSSATPTELLSGGTQMLTLAGSGFEPGTTVSLNGASYPITYIDYNDATAQVTVAPNAAGTLTLQIQNPAPGGASTTFTESVPPNSIALTATDSGGTNTGTAPLWRHVYMSAAVTGSMQTVVNWSVTGAGSISAAGVYAAPTRMPGSRAVTIQAALASNPAITATYELKVINPVPVITAASPAAVAGTTTMVTLTGTGIVSSTVIQVNGVVVPSTYVSDTSIEAQITVGAGATGSDPVQAYTPNFQGGTSDVFEVAISAPISATAAARLLDQTTFGPTTSLIQHVQSEGVTAWLNEQYNTPQTVLPLVPVDYPSPFPSGNSMARSEWWQTAITGNDQLRQRVAFALGQLFVVSTNTITGYEAQPYMNLLAQDAFSNWYTIMNDVTLSPAMGIYLNMLNSAKPTATLIANENYARENMQLFNLGLDLINQDGSLQYANGNPIPAYTEAQVQAFARAYTGWTFANQDGSTPPTFNGMDETTNYDHPMVAVEDEHDENPKILLNGTTLPAGQTAEEDLAGALTNIFQHPNVPPFVCKQLIQHLVKSDPSPQYISRCANVFINDGNGVRGDMQAVLTEILTDSQARAGDAGPQPSDGHLREPVLWMTAAMRGLGYVNVDPNDDWDNLSVYSLRLSERPYGAPSVFNFFPPSYVIPGTTLNAPEFAIENTASVADRLTLADQLVSNNIESFNVDLSATSPLGQILVAQGPAALVKALSGLFLHGTMDASTAAAITNEITSASNNPAQQLMLAVYLTITSSEYKILH